MIHPFAIAELERHHILHHRTRVALLFAFFAMQTVQRLGQNVQISIIVGSVSVIRYAASVVSNSPVGQLPASILRISPDQNWKPLKDEIRQHVSILNEGDFKVQISFDLAVCVLQP